ncbi:MAG: dihydrolipoyl dehydrogenase [Nitrospinales bacterium]
MSREKLLVIGAGPGGYASAFLAADKGMDVTLVDSSPQLGGVCLHRGCIPSKALLHLAKLISETREAKEWGLDFGDPSVDLPAIRNWKDQTISKMAKGLSGISKQRGVKLVSGKAVFKDSHSVIVNEEEIGFDKAIIAVGSRPVLPSQFNIGSRLIMDSTSALQLESIPKKLLVVGGGYIGLELGTAYSALGSEVTVVEMAGSLLAGIDVDLVRILQVRLRKQFEAIHLNTKVDSLRVNDTGLVAGLSGDSISGEHHFDAALVAIGRSPNSSGLGLENTDVNIDDNGFIKIDDQQKTDDPLIYAIGDVTEGPMLAHKASHQGRAAVETICGESTHFSERTIPAVVFTDPEIAWCGLTEANAKELGVDIKIAKFPWGASGRASTLGRNDGQTKLIIDPETEQVLGVGIVGTGAGELISEGLLAVEMGALAKDLSTVIHPHPTLSETLMEAADVFYGSSVHVNNRRS